MCQKHGTIPKEQKPGINDRDGKTCEGTTTDTHTKRERKETKKVTKTSPFFKPNKKEKKQEKKRLSLSRPTPPFSLSPRFSH
jgi:hypothetical protein